MSVDEQLRDERTAAWLGLALGVTFSICFATGLTSHLIQNPPGWFEWPPRPAGLYRITQGTHVVTGFVSIPLLLAKLWVVHPKLFAWPPVRGIAHGLERLALLPLVGGGLFLLFTGVLNVARWYPWGFFFPRAHYWAAWITIGALAIHVGAKAATTWYVVRHPAPDGGTSTQRRGFLGAAAATSGLVAVGYAGATVSWLSPISAFAQRRPGQGPQGLPVNKSAARARVTGLARDPAYRLEVVGGERELSLSLDDLLDRPQHEAELPIACVEGWSASATWGGVRLRDLLDEAGAPDDAEVTVESLQPHGLYKASVVNRRQARDPDTLLALRVRGETLHIDHGYPVRLIGPNRPGVQQTKWVGRLVIR